MNPSPSVSIPSQSLTFALRLVGRKAGVEIDHDDLNAALGLSWMVCAVPGDSDIGSWSMHARDAFLIEAARLFGMSVRDVHPPEAARGLDRAAEYDQHFDASYRPLILRALEHQQAVLAWRGWPGEQALAWGLIQGVCAEGVGFCGTTIASGSELDSPRTVTLIQPPIQLYVVERIVPTTPEASEVVSAGLDRARAVLSDAGHSRFGVVTGPQAYDERMTFVEAYAAAILAGHESGLRFLARHAVGSRDLLADTAVICSGMRELLRPGASPSARAAILSRCRETSLRLKGTLDALAAGRGWPGA